MFRLTIIIPCYNEQDNLPKLIDKLIQFSSKHGNYHIIFVNDGSKDGTLNILRNINHEKVSVVTHSRNRGYGAAIKSGILVARTDFCITIDGDGQHDLQDIPKMLNQLLESQSDMVVGNRSGKGSSGFRNLGKWMIRKFITTMTDLAIEDVNSGMKLYRTEVVKSLIKWAPNDMSFSETIVILHNHFRYKISELEINIFNRVAGQSTININTAIKAVKEIVFLLINFFPFRFFSFIGAVFFLSGMLWSLPFLLNGEGLTIGAGFILSSCVLIFLLGIILQTLTRMKFEDYVHINNE
jgi:glycosyltransferase involved in cell wall biosynthesis